MKTKLGKYYYDDPWTVLKFEKRDRGILYNGRTKQYNFYSLSDSSNKDKDQVLEELKTKYKNIRPYPYKMLIFLAAALGISVGFNFFNIF